MILQVRCCKMNAKLTFSGFASICREGTGIDVLFVAKNAKHSAFLHRFCALEFRMLQREAYGVSLMLRTNWADNLP